MRILIVGLLIIAAALMDAGSMQRHEIGVRHSLPDPYIPQCYAIEWLGGNYCELRL